MTSPALPVPSWATDTLYSTGPDVGLTTRYAPSAGTKAHGHVGDSRTAARIDNWRDGALCDWVAYLSTIAVRSWHPIDSDFDAAISGLTHTPGPAVGFNGGWRWLTLADSETTSVGRCMPSACQAIDSARAAWSTYTYAHLGVYSAAYNVSGVSVYAHRQLPESTTTRVIVEPHWWYFGASESEVVVDAAIADDIVRVHCTSAGTFIATSSAGEIYRSTTSGGSWTKVTPAVKSLAQPVCICSGLGRVLIGYSDAAASMVAISNDDGATWTYLQVDATDLQIRGLCRLQDRFFAITATGKLFFLADGTSTWYETSSTFAGCYLAGSCSGDQLASDGYNVVVVAAKDISVGFGVWVSVDAGVTFTWQLIDSGTVDAGAGGILTVAYDKGQFCFTAGLTTTAGVSHRMWLSGVAGVGTT